MHGVVSIILKLGSWGWGFLYLLVLTKPRTRTLNLKLTNTHYILKLLFPKCVQNLGKYQTEQVRSLLLNRLLIVTFGILWHNQSIPMEESYATHSLNHSILESLNILPGLVAVGGYHSGTLPVNICHNGWNDEKSIWQCKFTPLSVPDEIYDDWRWSVINRLQLLSTWNHRSHYHTIARLEICRDRHDQRSCKIFSNCVNFSWKQRVSLQNLRINMKFTHLFGKFTHPFLKSY